MNVPKLLCYTTCLIASLLVPRIAFAYSRTPSGNVANSNFSITLSANDTNNCAGVVGTPEVISLGVQGQGNFNVSTLVYKGTPTTINVNEATVPFLAFPANTVVVQLRQFIGNGYCGDIEGDQSGIVFTLNALPPVSNAEYFPIASTTNVLVTALDSFWQILSGPGILVLINFIGLIIILWVFRKLRERFYDHNRK